MMRSAVGLAVLILGTAMLGLWANFVTAPQIEAQVRSTAQAALEGVLPGGDVTLAVSGRDITVSGLATNEGGASAIKAALMASAGRRVVRGDLQDLPVAAPYVLTAQKEIGADGPVLTAQGVVPSDAVRAKLAPLLGNAAQGLTLAKGAPDGWVANAEAGLAALNLLQKGRLSVEGLTVLLAGEVVTAQEMAAVDQALAPLAMLVKDVEVLDDGLPVAYTLTYSAQGGGTLNGKLPFGITPDAVAQALGLASLAGDVKTALIREMGDIRYLSAWAAVLPQLDSLSAEVAPGVQRVQASLLPGADAAVVLAALETGGFDVQIAEAPKPEPEPIPEPAPAPEPATTQTPILDQVLPEMSDLGFEISSKGCQGAADALLAQTTIIFLPNLDTLDASAEAVLANLAAIARDCTQEGKLRAEIGGHTDTSGDAAENLALSARRAEAVRAALIAAGVPEAQLTAKGYGDAQPISENETKEGRAKNRRTTLVWSE